MALNSRLPAFLNARAGKPLIWGENDCGLWLADWLIVALQIEDPARMLRGCYKSARQLADLYGTVALLTEARAICRRVGLPHPRDPTLGDIAVIELRRASNTSPRVIVGAIRGKGGWIVPAPRGVSKLPDDGVRLIVAWRVVERDASSYCGTGG